VKLSGRIWLLIAVVVVLLIGAAPFDPQPDRSGPTVTSTFDEDEPIQALAFQGVPFRGDPELWQVGNGQCPGISF
jgi:hypothetical protein